MLGKIALALAFAALPQSELGHVTQHPLQVCRPINPTYNGPTADLGDDEVDVV